MESVKQTRAVVPEVLSIQEAALRLSVNEHTIYKWISVGLLHAFRVGPRLLRIPEREVTRLFNLPH